MIDEYTDKDLPLETIYLDISYMDAYQDFTVDTTNFPDLATFTDTLHTNNQKIVPIIDAALSTDDPTSTYYQQALTLDVLILSNLTGKPLEQRVWPEHAVFLDWFHPDAYEVW